METIELNGKTYYSEQPDTEVSSDNLIVVGKKYFFRTVTYHLIGRVEKVTEKTIKLSDASWVADSGRFMNAIKVGTLNEVEPLGDWYFERAALVDYGEWIHELPSKQK